jgi:hypothetical protein
MLFFPIIPNNPADLREDIQTATIMAIGLSGDIDE